jgi:hypothetical protein
MRHLVVLMLGLFILQGCKKNDPAANDPVPDEPAVVDIRDGMVGTYQGWCSISTNSGPQGSAFEILTVEKVEESADRILLKHSYWEVEVQLDSAGKFLPAGSYYHVTEFFIGPDTISVNLKSDVFSTQWIRHVFNGTK